MADRSTFMVVAAAKQADANTVFEAWGRGPGTFSVPASATGSDPATHYFAHDGSMSVADSAVCAAMPDDGGTLPTISGGWLTWFSGEANEAAAIVRAKAACSAMSIAVATNISGADHRAGILDGLTLQEIQLEI